MMPQEPDRSQAYWRGHYDSEPRTLDDIEDEDAEGCNA